MLTGDRITLDISSLGYGGDGIGRSHGFVVFVPRGVPGDRVEVVLGRVKKRHASARIAEIITPSDARRPVSCPLFDDGTGDHLGCGGCQWLHIDYPTQIEWKGRFVEESLRRIGGITVGIEAVRDAEPAVACRNKLSASIGDDRTLGLCIEHSPDVLSLTHCPMESEANNRALAGLQELYAAHAESLATGAGLTQIHLRNAPNDAVSLCLYADKRTREIDRLASTLISRGMTGSAGMLARRRFSHLAGAKSLMVQSGRIKYEVPVDTFFQTNYQQSAVLLDLVRTGLNSLPEGARILDLYAGVGFFALDLALDRYEVTSVEGHPAAVAASIRTAKRIKARGRFLRHAVDSRLFSGDELAGGFDGIVLDPPRAGCGPEVSRAICGLGASRIVYVSCAPDTLARDLAVMQEHGYVVERVTPVDMFPQTYHVEVVVELAKSSGS